MGQLRFQEGEFVVTYISSRKSVSQIYYSSNSPMLLINIQFFAFLHKALQRCQRASYLTLTERKELEEEKVFSFRIKFQFPSASRTDDLH